MLLSSLGWLPSSARAMRLGAMSHRTRAVVVGVILLALGVARGLPIHADVAPIATVGLTPGWVTFGQVVPHGFAFDGLQVGSLPTQTDVKTRWSDGSIRFAVVTVKAGAAGSLPVMAGAASGPAFVPAIPTATVTLTIAGVPYVATLPVDPSSDRWLSGPHVYEGRSTIAPVSAVSGAHPFLRVNFDTRAYSDGKARVDISVENVLDQTGATTVSYSVAINVNGASVWSKPAVEHYYMTRWRKIFEVGPSPFGSVTPDITPFNQARALPPYLPLVANVVDSVVATDGTPLQRFDILRAGALNNPMWDHSGRPELAPYPDWTARYLVHKNPTQRAFVLANGDLSGSWPFHIREPEGSPTSGVGPDRFISLDQRPTVWLDDRADTDPIVKPEDRVKGRPMQMHEYGLGIPAPGQSPLGPDIAHQPSLAYVPYLLTGDRYYGEEMGFIANYNLIHTYDGDGVRSDSCATCPRVGRNGVIANNEVRGYGWGLRNLVDAAAYAPNAEARDYFSHKVRNNLSWLDDYAHSQDPVKNPLRILWTGFRPEIGYVSLWEQSYLAFAIDRANAQGFVGGLEHRDAIARMQLRLFTSEPVYPRLSDQGCVDPNNPGAAVKIPCDWGAPYLIAAGQVPDPTSWNGFTFFTTIEEIAAHTVGNPNLQRPYEGFYGPEARLNLMIGVNNTWGGAQESYDYLYPFIGVNNSACSVAYGGDGSADRPDLACRAGWALDFYPKEVTPPPPVNHAPGVTAIADQNNQVGDTVSLAVQAADEDGNTLTYTATGLPNGLAIDSSSGVITGTLTLAGDFSVTVRASDGALFGEAAFAWHVTTPPQPNRAPVVTAIADQSNQVGDPINVAVHATDADGDTLSYSATGLPGGAAINATTGAITGTLTTAGDFTVTARASDGGAAGEASFKWHVAAKPQPDPGIVKELINPGPQQNSERDRVALLIKVVLYPSAVPSFTVGSIKFSARNLPPGLQIGRFTGLISGEIERGAAGIYATTVTVTETSGRQLSQTFQWTVLKKNRGPRLQNLDHQSSKAGVAITPLVIKATDRNGDALTFSATALPPGLHISADGIITGTIASGGGGEYDVQIVVSDGQLVDADTLHWRVEQKKSSKKG